MKTPLLLASIVLLIVNTAFAQPATITVHQYAEPYKDWADTVNMPEVTLATKLATERANYYILAAVIDEITPSKGLKKFVKDWGSHGGKQGYNVASLNYDVIRNDGLILSILFHLGNDAYLPFWDRAVTLDAATGIPIAGNTLFLPTRLDHVRHLVLEERTNLIRLDSIELARDTEVHMPEAERLDILHELADCAQKIELGSILVSNDWFEPDGLTCFFWPRISYDIDWSVRIPLASLQLDLSDYGKALLVNHSAQPLAVSDSNAFILMRGKLGKRAITMMMHKIDTLQTAYYFFDGSSKLTEVTGSFHGNSLEMQDQTYNEPTQIFEGTRTNGVFEGIWRKGKKTMPFELHPY